MKIFNSGNISVVGNISAGTDVATAKITLSGINTGAALDLTNTTPTDGRTMRIVSQNIGGLDIQDMTAGGVSRFNINSIGNATFSGRVTASSNLSWGAGSYTTGVSELFNSAIDGTVLVPKAGSTYDFVLTNGAGGNVLTVPTGTFNVNVVGNLTASSYSGGASLTGTPTAPTATAGTNTTQIATTAFVQSAASSGTYTPTVTAGSNTSSISNNGISHYSKNGNEVTVFGSLTVTPTAGSAAGTNTIFSISLPIASNFTAGEDLFGHGSALYNNGGNNVSYSSSYVGSSSTDDCSGSVIAFATNAITIRYSFMYTVK
jgi:hypothetical protein